MRREHQQLTPHSEEWNSCQSGEIRGMVASLRREQRQHMIKQGAGVAIPVILLGFFSVMTMNGPPPPQRDQRMMTCHEVIQNAEAYVAGRLSDLVNGRIEVHLEGCPYCQSHIQTLRAGLNSKIVVPSVLQKEQQNTSQLTWIPDLQPEFSLAVASSQFPL